MLQVFWAPQIPSSLSRVKPRLLTAQISGLFRGIELSTSSPRSLVGRTRLQCRASWLSLQYRAPSKIYSSPGVSRKASFTAAFRPITHPLLKLRLANTQQLSTKPHEDTESSEATTPRPVSKAIVLSSLVSGHVCQLQCTAAPSQVTLLPMSGASHLKMTMIWLGAWHRCSAMLSQQVSHWLVCTQMPQQQSVCLQSGFGRSQKSSIWSSKQQLALPNL